MSGFAWWRRLRGGVWEQWRDIAAPGCGSFWWRRVSSPTEHDRGYGSVSIVSREDYTR